MDLDMQKEQFSIAYVKAIAACSGFASSIPSVDDDSVDMTLYMRGGRGTIRSPRIDLQVKCKAARSPADDTFSYSIKLKNYDDLREPNLLVPRLLVVVLVPEDLPDWHTHSEHELVLRRCGYWISLRGLPPSDNATSQTVRVPRNQRFDVASLQAMMERIGQGALP